MFQSTTHALSLPGDFHRASPVICGSSAGIPLEFCTDGDVSDPKGPSSATSTTKTAPIASDYCRCNKHGLPIILFWPESPRNWYTLQPNGSNRPESPRIVANQVERWPEGFDNYKLIVSVGHDEYYSATQRVAMQRFVDGSVGGRIAFFAGNLATWQTRFDGSAEADAAAAGAEGARELEGYDFVAAGGADLEGDYM